MPLTLIFISEQYNKLKKLIYMFYFDLVEIIQSTEIVK